MFAFNFFQLGEMKFQSENAAIQFGLEPALLGNVVLGIESFAAQEPRLWQLENRDDIMRQIHDATVSVVRENADRRISFERIVRDVAQRIEPTARATSFRDSERELVEGHLVALHYQTMAKEQRESQLGAALLALLFGLEHRFSELTLTDWLKEAIVFGRRLFARVVFAITERTTVIGGRACQKIQVHRPPTNRIVVKSEVDEDVVFEAEYVHVDEAHVLALADQIRQRAAPPMDVPPPTPTTMESSSPPVGHSPSPSGALPESTDGDEPEMKGRGEEEKQEEEVPASVLEEPIASRLRPRRVVVVAPAPVVRTTKKSQKKKKKTK